MRYHPETMTRVRRFLGGVALAALLAAWLPASAAEVPQTQWQGIDRVVAFADVHGAYTELTALLQSVGVVDDELRWSGGRTHLVSLGDLLDRGADSRKVMDLLIRLQAEATAAGGRMHVVLGNHEAMNVLGDLRYVDRGEFAAYAADEDPAERAARKAEFLARQGAAASEADFDQAFPPGFFAHRRLLGPEGTYGRWLLAQPAAIRINDIVYMHGGPSAVLAGRTLEQLSGDYTRAVEEYLSAERALRDAGLLQFEDAYGRRPDLAQARLDAMPADESRSALAAAVARFRKADEDPLLGPDGPNWYRGAAFCNECAEADVLDPFLASVGARRLVIGHTVARNGTVVSRFDGKVVKLDAGMNRAVYRGRPAALISDATGSRVAYALPTVPPAAVPAEPLYLSSQQIDEAEVREVLARGEIAVTETCAPGVLEVKVSLGGRTVDAVFEATDRDTIRHELAAFELDRLLDLGLVPATVARSHGGQDGVLQGRPANWASEQDRQNARNGARAGLACQTISITPQAEPARRPSPSDGRPPKLPVGGWCDLKRQYQLAYAFDALIDNKGRTLDRYLYDADASTIFLTGHGDAFGTATQIPGPLEAEVAKTGKEMGSRLRALDPEAARRSLEPLIGSKELKSLMQRRERILELASSPKR